MFTYIFLFFSNSQHSEIESFQLQTQSVDLSPMKLAQNQPNGGGGGGVPIGSQRLRQVCNLRIIIKVSFPP